MKSTLNFLFVISTLLTGLALTTSPARAQTFTGQPILTETPGSLRTIITRINHSSVLIIGYENQDGGSVSIRIQDKRGTVLLEESQYKRAYAGRYDLAGLSPGLYSIELKTLTSRHIGTVSVDSPASQAAVTVIEQFRPAGDELMVTKK
jgi:hypothetical protein